MNKDICIYENLNSWDNEKPDVILKGNVKSKNANIIEIQDENGLTQLLNMDKLFAIVY